MLQTSTVKETTFGLLKCLQAEPLLATTRLVGGTALGDVDELLIPEIRMNDYLFDFSAVQKRIIKMTDYPNKVYSTAPLKKSPSCTSR